MSARSSAPAAPPQGNQRWRRGRDAYRPPAETIDTHRYEVAAIAGDGPARAFVKTHHYSRTYPAARYRFGLYRHGHLVGVAVFSVPMNPRAVTNALPTDDPQAGVELGRFVLLDRVPGNGETWFLARCFEHLRAEGLCGVVSFSDPLPRKGTGGGLVFPGHVGTIYQAHNAHYLGRSAARGLWLLPDGTVFSPRAQSKLRAGDVGWRYAAEQLVRAGAEVPPGFAEDEVLPPEALRAWLARVERSGLLRRVRHPGNYKYAWHLQGKQRPNPHRYPKTKALWQERLFR